ncbi:MAG: hypothetical protein FJ280_27460 [Planctomycetes bacterium]|nr:hypothetical protein [Planctomycetota bacterium]
MIDKEIQHLVSQAITETEPQAEKYYHLCWWQGQIQCHHVHHTKETHEIFYTAAGHRFREGLSAFQWQLVTTRIADFCRTRGIALAVRPRRRPEDRPRPVPPRRVTEFDSRRLHLLLAGARTPGSKLNPYLDQLQQLLETADIVAPRDIPQDVITMNSKIRLKDDHVDHEMALSLVFPADACREADIEKFDVSVLSPLGLSLLGRRAGDIVEGHVRIDALLYQPEAAGDFHL